MAKINNEMWEFVPLSIFYNAPDFVLDDLDRADDEGEIKPGYQDGQFGYWMRKEQA